MGFGQPHRPEKPGLNPLLTTGASCRVLFLTLPLLFSVPAASQPAPEQGVVQTETHIVLVNVVAKDKHGKPVDDLRREDFVLLDNDQEQKIALFALEKAGESATAVASSPNRLTFTNRPEQGGAAVPVFLFDELNTKLADQQLAKKDFVRYLRNLPADGHVAVFVLGDSLALLHDFSQDMASLLGAIEKHTNRVNPEVAAATAPPPRTIPSPATLPSPRSGIALFNLPTSPTLIIPRTVRATRTAWALKTIGGHLQGIPERKTLIWISGAFPIQLGLHSSWDSIPQDNPNARLSNSANQRGGVRGAGARGGGGQTGGNTSSDSSTSSNSNQQLPYSGQTFESDSARDSRLERSRCGGLSRGRAGHHDASALPGGPEFDREAHQAAQGRRSHRLQLRNAGNPGRGNRRPSVPPHQRPERGHTGGCQRSTGTLLAGVRRPRIAWTARITGWR
jgi:VWFA-related protein